MDHGAKIDMYKLVILIEPFPEWQKLDEGWPEFLHLSEEMPGLRREASSQVLETLFGNGLYVRMHELFFDSEEGLRAAMASPPGQAAGRLLQQITHGNLVLFIAEHQQDDLDHIRAFRKADAQAHDG
ncbi:MAG: EthD family reductase [Omnitrophica WOR_2 bacterium]